MRNIAAAFVVLLALVASASAQSTVNPGVPGQNSSLSSAPIRGNFAAAYADLNNLFGCSAGLTAPAGPSTFRLWCDTTGAPTNIKVKQWDGAQWLITGIINQTTHAYTPAIGGGSILSSPNIFTAVQTVDLGSGVSEPVLAAGTGWAVYGADGVAARFVANEFNNSVSGSAASFDGRTSLGTRVSPATVTNGTVLAQFQGKGYDTSTWEGTAGALRIIAQGTFSTSSHPGQACLATAPTGSITPVNNFCVNQDGTASLIGAFTVPQVTSLAGTNVVINAPSGQGVQLAVNGSAITVQQAAVFLPTSDNAIGLGGVNNRWANTFSVAVNTNSVSAPTGVNLILNAPTSQQILFEINGVQEASIAAGGVYSVGVAGSQQGSIILASPTANAMTLVSASSATGTATIPTGTYNFIGDTLTQSLTNKTYNGLTITTTTGTITLASSKTFTVNNSISLIGTDATTYTFPTTTSTLAGLGVAQTFSAANVFSSTLVFSGLSGGAATKYVCLDASNNVVSSIAAC